VIAIDPGDDADEVAAAIARALTDAGARPEVLEARGRAPSERARAANDLGAAVCISLHRDPDGALACACFGSDSTHSPAGERLAGMILEELERITGRAGRLQRLTVAMLRETRMPAVQVEPGGGEAGGPSAEAVGDAVAAGVRRFYGEPSD
jgi:N-acetylmuramoyl-L-alanine amidase